MGKSAQARQAEKEWNEKYGNMTSHEIEDVVKQSIQKKFDDRRARAEQKLAEQEAKYNLPYGGLVKAVAKSSKQIKDLENKPDELMSAMREKLEEEFSELVNAGVFDENDVTAREMCISKKLIAYMDDPKGEYYKAKEELQQARNDYAIYLAKKEEWEQENADIINAERIRTKRAELMQADPEALRALGIEPDPVSTTVASGVSGADTDDGKEALREALRSIHPSASDAEIESMVKLV